MTHQKQNKTKRKEKKMKENKKVKNKIHLNHNAVSFLQCQTC